MSGAVEKIELAVIKECTLILFSISNIFCNGIWNYGLLDWFDLEYPLFQSSSIPFIHHEYFMNLEFE